VNEVIITVVTMSDPYPGMPPYPITSVRRIEFDTKGDLELWLNKCADGESPMLDKNVSGVVHGRGIGVTNIERLTAY
jgi:hypothetical protein